MEVLKLYRFYIQEEPKADKIVYQWHLEEEKINQGKPKKKQNDQLSFPQQRGHTARQDPF